MNEEVMLKDLNSQVLGEKIKSHESDGWKKIGEPFDVNNRNGVLHCQRMRKVKHEEETDEEETDEGPVI